MRRVVGFTVCLGLAACSRGQTLTGDAGAGAAGGAINQDPPGAILGAYDAGRAQAQSATADAGRARSAAEERGEGAPVGARASEERSDAGDAATRGMRGARGADATYDAGAK